MIFLREERLPVSSPSVLRHPKRGVDEMQEIKIQGGARALKVVAYPGHQGPTVINNVHLVRTPEDLTVVQTGDRSGAAGPGTDFDWLAQFGH